LVATAYERIREAMTAEIMQVNGLEEPTSTTLPEVDQQTPTPAEHNPIFVIAVDFGTTYSTVAFTKSKPNIALEQLGIDDIRCVDNYNFVTGGGAIQLKAQYENVPTDILYVEKGLGDATDDDSDVSDIGLDFDDSLSIPRHSTTNNTRKRKRRSSTRPRPPTTVLWGYGAHKRQQKHKCDVPEDNESHELVRLIKISLDEDSPHTKGLRSQLHIQFERMQRIGFVRDRNQIISCYLTRLLRHAKKILTRKEDLRPDSDVRFVLTIPVCWSEKACRIMHDAMAKAIRHSGLTILDTSIIPDLFMISEAEAAAQYVVATEDKCRLLHGEVFVLLDAGGGTVDASMYRVTSDTGPLRLQAEVVEPEGALCGSTFINDRHAQMLMEKLDGEQFTFDYNLQGWVDGIVSEWEADGKEDINIEDPKNRVFTQIVPGIKPNLAKGFKKRNFLAWTEDEVRAMFEPSLRGTTQLLERQLDRAFGKDVTVTKIIVVGGFAACKSLQVWIQRLVETKRNTAGATIDIVWSEKFPTSVVARGAVLRALDKKNGPRRRLRSSFGIQVTEEYDETKLRPEFEIAKVKPTTDLDGWRSVKDTIRWIIQAVGSS
jgi:molecular chaperone DnaK (HSP70)